MSRRPWLCITAWLVLAAAGLWLHSLVLTLIAPMVLAALPVLARARRARSAGRRLTFDPLEPIWALAALFAFTYLLTPALAALDPASFNSLPGYLDGPPAQRLFATWLAGIAVLALVAGYALPVADRAGTALSRLKSTDDNRVVGLTAAVLFALGLGSVFATVAINHGASLSLVDLVTGGLRQATVASFTGRGYLSVGFAALALSVPGVALWAAVRRGRLAWAVTAVTGLVAFGCLAGIVGSRIYGLSIPVGVLVVYHYRVRRLPLWAVVGGGGAVVAAAVAQIAIRGDASVTGPLSAAGALARTLNGFEFLVNTLGRVDHFLWGRTIGEDALLTYVPRGLWSDKPTYFGFVRAQELVVPGLYRDVGKSATFPIGIVAEGYVNFGVLGAILLPFGAAAALRALYVRVAISPDPFFVLLLAWTLPNLLSLMRGVGQMLPTTGATMIMLCPLLIARRRQ